MFSGLKRPQRVVPGTGRKRALCPACVRPLNCDAGPANTVDDSPGGRPFKSYAGLVRGTHGMPFSLDDMWPKLSMVRQRRGVSGKSGRPSIRYGAQVVSIHIVGTQRYSPRFGVPLLQQTGKDPPTVKWD